jgi:tripartite ATP-independent transporter DctM subunit
MMPWGEAALILIGLLTVALISGLPVAFAFMAVNIVGAIVFLGGEAGLMQMARNSVTAVTSFTLTPIVFFVLMGALLFHSGVALKAIDAVEQLIRRVPGRLAVVAVVAGTLFSAVSGSTIATTALLGTLLLPRMLARGYEKKAAMGPIMAIGGVDVLIPPSALAVLLGSLAGISIADLLFAGILPGLVMAALFVVYIVATATLNPSIAPDDGFEAKEGLARYMPFFVYVVPLATIFVAVIGSMSSGVATPTEAAAVGAAACLVLVALYGGLSWTGLFAALRETLAISGMLLFVILASTTFSQILNFSGATAGFVDLFVKTGWGELATVFAMTAVILILGCFVDQVSIMMITLPFFMPIAAALSIDKVWLGVVMLIGMQMGLLTPPFGLLLFTMKSVAPKDVTMGEVYRAALPYIAIGMAVLLAVILWPPLATWLPALL